MLTSRTKVVAMDLILIGWGAVAVGVIPAEATCPLMISFFPRSLGQHEVTIKIQVMGSFSGRPVASITLKAAGFSSRAGKKFPLVGGPTAKAGDFQKPLKFVDDAEVHLL